MLPILFEATFNKGIVCFKIVFLFSSCIGLESTFFFISLKDKAKTFTLECQDFAVNYPFEGSGNILRMDGGYLTAAWCPCGRAAKGVEPLSSTFS